MQANRRFPTALVAMTLLVAASPRAQQATKGATIEWSDEQQQSATAWAQRFEQRLLSEDVEESDGLGFFDHESIITAALEGVEVDDERTLVAFRKGLLAGIKRNDATLFAQWRAARLEFKRVLLVDGRAVARFRFAGDEGISILDMPLTQTDDGWRAVDMLNHAVGLGMVEGIRQNAVVLLPGLDAGALSRLFGVGKTARRDADHVKAMMQHRQKGDYADAVAEYKKLSKAMQRTASMTAVHIECLGMLADEQAYAVALERAAKRHPAPKFRLMLVDAHFLRERWDAAIACVDEFMQAIERDAALLTLRATLQLAAGRVEDARKSMSEAIALEPDCEYALSTGLDVWLAAKDWATVRDAIIALEKGHGYDFKGQLTDELWAGFVAAPESEPWR